MNLLAGFMDLIYPPRCPICLSFLSKDGTHGKEPFCEQCLKGFDRIHPPLCPVCGTPHGSDRQTDHLCGECHIKRPFYEICRAPYLYRGAAMTAVHVFKYGQKLILGDQLGVLLADFAQEWIGGIENLLVMPVPLHPARLRQRGFNQSLVLARHVAGRLGAELDFLSLRRIKKTLPQTGLGKKERKRNVNGAFALENISRVRGRSVLLIDDVSTTGNTLSQCALALKKGKAKEVFCLVFARAVN